MFSFVFATLLTGTSWPEAANEVQLSVQYTRTESGRDTICKDSLQRGTSLGTAVFSIPAQVFSSRSAGKVHDHRDRSTQDRAYQLPDRRMRARGCVVPAYTHKQLAMQIKEAGKKAPTAVRTALREEHSVQHIVSSVHHATVHA